MKKSIKKYLYILIFSVAFLLAAGTGALAARTYCVNDAENVLQTAITETYALGADGADLIGTGAPYALTAEGIVPLSETVQDDGAGGGGLLFDDGEVAIAADKVKVGLYYYYSANRDSSLEVARLENAVGRGYAFGYLDGRAFIPCDGEAAVTEETQLTMRPTGEGGVAVYSTVTDELLWTQESTGKNNYFAILPLPEGGADADMDMGETLTWFKGNRYYGAFAYADLGNGKLTVVNVVDVERYAEGVCAQEMGSGFPTEALKAQAVAARTYAMFYIHGETYTARCGFDLTADDYSQVYSGYTDFGNIVSAVKATENQYLTYGGKIIEALFCAADGGETLDSELVFSTAAPYLRGYPDPYEGAAWPKGAYGHRVGMSQWGAYAMAKYFDKDYKDILGFYYTKVGLSYGYME